MTNFSIRATILLIVLAFLATAATADELVFSSGKKFQGTVTGYENGVLSFDTGEKELSIAVSLVKSLQTESSDPEVRALVDKIQARNEKKAQRLTAMKNQKKVDIYVIDGCRWSIKMEKILEENNIVYNRYDVRNDAQASSRMHRMGGQGVPFIVIDDRIRIKGYKPEKLQSELKKMKEGS